MNPIRPCPQCGRDTDFHEDELQGVKDGSSICLSCGMDLEEARLIVGIAHGEHPELVEELLNRREEDDDEQSDDE